jgi:hypothetical protein
MRGKIDPKCYNGMDKVPCRCEPKMGDFVPLAAVLTMNFGIFGARCDLNTARPE